MATSIEDLMLLIEIETLALKNSHLLHIKNDNFSAGRRARVSSIKLTNYLKEYRQKSIGKHTGA